MAYKNRIIYILLLLIVGSSSYRLSATSHSDSTRHHLPKAPSVSAPTTVLTQRQFASLEAFVQAQAQTISTQPIHITAPAEFTEAYIRDNFTVSAAVADSRDSAKAAFGQIDKTNNYVESFAMDNLLELPVGLKKRVGNSDVVIGIVKARFYQGYAEMTVFCKIDLPQKVGSDGARTIFFG